jgi:glycosyltransferase involved in cell wall biosynthesis
MVIVHIIAGLQANGAENFLLRLCRKLDGHTHHVISLTTLGPVAESLAASGIAVEALGMKTLAQMPGKMLALVRRIRELRPDIVQTWMYHADLLGGLAARLAGAPKVVWSIRHSNLDRHDNKAATLAVARLCALLSRFIPDAIVTNSAAARTSHARIGYRSREFVVIPNGFDLDRFRADPLVRAEMRRALGVADDCVLIGMIGRFELQKGHRYFLDAAGKVLSSGGNVRFVLVGNGVDRDNAQLAAWIALNGLGSSATLLGPRRDIPALLASLDLLVLPSIGEAFPNVVGEAMATAVPCVVTDVGDCAWLVDDTALVVPPRDVDALASAIDRMVAMQPGQRKHLGEMGRRRVAENFEMGSVARRYAQFYDQLFATVASGGVPLPTRGA